MSQEIHLVLSGLTCPACVRRVDQKLRAVAGVTDVQIDLAAGKALVTRQAAAGASPEAAPLVADLIAAVERAGYSASPGARQGDPPGPR